MIVKPCFCSWKQCWPQKCCDGIAFLFLDATNRQTCSSSSIALSSFLYLLNRFNKHTSVCAIVLGVWHKARIVHLKTLQLNIGIILTEFVANLLVVRTFPCQRNKSTYCMASCSHCHHCFHQQSLTGPQIPRIQWPVPNLRYPDALLFPYLLPHHNHLTSAESCRLERPINGARFLLNTCCIGEISKNDQSSFEVTFALEFTFVRSNKTTWAQVELEDNRTCKELTCTCCDERRVQGRSKVMTNWNNNQESLPVASKDAVLQMFGYKGKRTSSI